MFSGMSVVFEGSREDFFPDLMSWAQENGASCEGFTISSFGKEGYGLRATRDIKVRSRYMDFNLYLNHLNDSYYPNWGY